MDIETLLSTHGLIDANEGNRIRWFTSMASESPVDMDEDEADYTILNVSGIRPGDYVQFKHSAEVVIGETGEYVFIEAIDGRKYYFRVYKMLDTDEVAELFSGEPA